MNLDRDGYFIQSIPWKIRGVISGDPRIDDDYGKADFNNDTIWIASDDSVEQQLETLLHETIHILTRGRDKFDLTQEDELRTFSMMLFDTLVRNRLMPTLPGEAIGTLIPKNESTRLQSPR